MVRGAPRGGEIRSTEMQSLREMFPKFQADNYCRDVIIIRVDQMRHNPKGTLRGIDQTQVMSLHQDMYVNGIKENSGLVSVVLAEGIAAVSGADERFEGLQEPTGGVEWGGAIVACREPRAVYTVCDGDHRLEAYLLGLSRAVKEGNVEKRQRFAFLRVMLWRRKDGAGMSQMELIQAGVWSNEAVKFSRGMDLRDIMNMCIQVATRFEEMMIASAGTGSLPPERQRRLADGALAFLLYETETLQVDSPRGAETYAKLANVMRQEKAVAEEFNELWDADLRVGKPVLSISLFRLTSFSRCAPGSRRYVLRALHHMVKVHRKPSSIRPKGDDKVFFQVATALLGVVGKARGEGWFKSVERGEENVGEIWKEAVVGAVGAGRAVLSVADMFTRMAGNFDVSKRGKDLSSALQAVETRFRNAIWKGSPAGAKDRGSSGLESEKEGEEGDGEAEGETGQEAVQAGGAVEKGGDGEDVEVVEKSGARGRRGRAVVGGGSRIGGGQDEGGRSAMTGASRSGGDGSPSLYCSEGEDYDGDGGTQVVLLEDGNVVVEENSGGRDGGTAGKGAEMRYEGGTQIPETPVASVQRPVQSIVSRASVACSTGVRGGAPIGAATAVAESVADGAVQVIDPPAPPSLPPDGAVKRVCGKRARDGEGRAARRRSVRIRMSDSVPRGIAPGAVKDRASYDKIVERVAQEGAAEEKVRRLQRKAWVDGVSCVPSVAGGDEGRNGDVVIVSHVTPWLCALGVPEKHRAHSVCREEEVTTEHWHLFAHCMVQSLCALPAVRLRLCMYGVGWNETGSGGWASWVHGMTAERWFEVMQKVPSVAFEWLAERRMQVKMSGKTLMSGVLVDNGADENASSAVAWMDGARVSMVARAVWSRKTLVADSVAELFVLYSEKAGEMLKGEGGRGDSGEGVSNEWWERVGVEQHCEGEEGRGGGGWWFESRAETMGVTFEKEENAASIVWSKAMVEVRIAHMLSLVGLEEEYGHNFFIPTHGSRFMTVDAKGRRQPAHQEKGVLEVGCEGEREGSSGAGSGGAGGCSMTMTVYFTGMDAVDMFVWDSSHRYGEMGLDGEAIVEGRVAVEPSRVTIPPFSLLVVHEGVYRALAGVEDYSAERRGKWVQQRPMVGQLLFFGERRGEHGVRHGDRRSKVQSQSQWSRDLVLL